MSNYIAGGPGHSLKDWFEVYGRSWRTWWRWVVELGIMPHDDKQPLIDREWHQENEQRQMCHRYLGNDYHYCTPGDRCMGWSKRERERTLPSKALLGWSGQARKPTRPL